VERAQSKVIDAPLFELYKPAYDLDNVNAALNLLYRLWGDQESSDWRQNT
jgi:hypothetical protein